MTTRFTHESVRETALAQARGCYQRNLLTGWQIWSGADLRGKARKFNGRYARSRDNLIERMTRAGLLCQFIYGGHGRKILTVRKQPIPKRPRSYWKRLRDELCS